MFRGGKMLEGNGPVNLPDLKCPAIIRDLNHNIINANNAAKDIFRIGSLPCKCHKAIHSSDSLLDICYCHEGPMKVTRVFEPFLELSFERVNTQITRNSSVVGYLDIFNIIQTPYEILKDHAAGSYQPVIHDMEQGFCQDSTVLIGSLTGKEQEALKWIMKGKTSSEIGEMMGISRNTVSFHMKNLFDKLGAENRTHAAALVFKELSERNITSNREMHHRVMNNFALLSALIGRKMSVSSSVSVKEALLWVDGHIRNFTNFHRLILSEPTGTSVPVKELFEKAIDNINESLDCYDRDIALTCDIQDAFLHVNDAIPYVKIINELVTNAVKHAFMSGKGGYIHVSFRMSEEDGTCLLKVKDNGVGSEEGSDVFHSDSFGGKIVRSLIRQIGGQYHLRRDSGTEIVISSSHSK